MSARPGTVELLKDLGVDLCDMEPDEIDELLDTGSVTITYSGRKFVLSLNIQEESA